MLHILSGSDFPRLQKRIAEITKGCELIRFGEGGKPLSEAPSYLGASGLFGTKNAIRIDRPFDDAESKEFFLEHAERFAKSDMPVVVIADVDAATKKKLPKGASIEAFDAKHEEESAPNTFALADAFAAGDRKKAWVLYRQAIENGAAAEELHGILSWQVRAMVLSSKTKSATEAGLKPFVYTKAKKAASRFTVEAVENLSRELVSLYHQSRMGQGSLEDLLEVFLLKK